MLAQDQRLLDSIEAVTSPRQIDIRRIWGDFPQQIITVPDEWEQIQLAPLYDVHIGARAHDQDMFERHLGWIRDTPDVLTWNGGDMIENASKMSVGSGVYEQDFDPNNQMVKAILSLASIRHKMMFALPGNHEDRTNLAGVDLGFWMAQMLRVGYFPDFCFTTIRWRGNNFRILAHHGSGGATTAGAQRMAARKSLSWAKPIDLYWTGHLHNPLVDVLYQTDVDQSTQEYFERNAFIVISPSYLRYFGTYAAKKQMPPGTRGLGVVILRPDGRMDVSLHARGRRL